jgi:archaemetzincin
MRRCLLPLFLFAALVAATPEVTEEHLTLVVVPLGEPSKDLVEFVAGSLRKRFLLTVRVTDPEPLPESAWYPPRKRWRAEKLLSHLKEMDLGDAWRVCGITEEEISTTKGQRYDYGIAGLADLGGKASVLTSYLFRRVKKNRKRYLRYMENLVLHEVGHTLGLDHCPLERCIMADAKGNALRAARVSINEFCPRCTRLLRRHLRDPGVKGEWSAKERAVLKKLHEP